MLFYSVPDSRFGPFTIGMVRVSSLAGISRFGYAVRGWVDNEHVAAEFGRRFGYRLEPGVVRIRRRYDRVWGTVEVDGALMLEAGLTDPQPVAGKDVNHAGHLNLARIVNERGEAAPTLVQAGPVLAFSSSDHGKPQVTAFDVEGDRARRSVLADLGVHRLVRLQVQSRHVPVRSEPSHGRSQHDPRRSVARRLTTGSRRSR